MVVFDSRHVGKLCSVLGERINDGGFIGLIEKLFECEAVWVELGGFELGKGLPQECGLCGVLINVYLNGFDRRIQRIRLRMNDLNPKFDNVSDAVVYKPLKVFAVKYLDEILMVASGPKMVGMDLLNWVVKYLEGELELKVDRGRTISHSATSEKIEFLGMEFQAVPLSVLRPPLSGKAKRARLKFRRQKEVRAMERNRRKLGMKVFSHVEPKPSMVHDSQNMGKAQLLITRVQSPSKWKETSNSYKQIRSIVDFELVNSIQASLSHDFEPLDPKAALFAKESS